MRGTAKQHSHRDAKKGYQLPRAYLLGATIVLIAAGGWLASGSAQQPFNSVEVKFADIAPSGLKILPASCDSPLPTAPGNGSGFEVPNGTNNQAIEAFVAFCVTNNGGPTYFIPANSTNEVLDFYNDASNNGLSGVTVSPN